MFVAEKSHDEIDDIINHVIASSLGISAAEIHDNLGYHSIPQWDSTGHVLLMLAVEDAFQIKVQEHVIQELFNVGAIRAYLHGVTRQGPSTSEIKTGEVRSIRAPEAQQPLQRGLANAVIDNTWISRVDGATGTLEYRGYSIHDLVRSCSFEEVAYLLLNGELPTPQELASFSQALQEAREVPNPVLDLVRSLRTAHPACALRTAISALPAYTAPPNDDLRQGGIRLVAQVPVLIGAHNAARAGRELVQPARGEPFAKHCLTLLLGREPDAMETGLMERSLILHADLAANPSAFAARVAASCNADIYASITAAVAAFAGSLHGGAAEHVLKMADEIGTPERAAAYVTGRWSRNDPIMGFGHRVFRVEDPRVRHFREAAQIISRNRGDMRSFEVITAIAEAMMPYARYGVSANVDLYAGLIYRHLGLADDLAVPLFIAGRMVGWVAQAIEQQASNILIYPLLKYMGEVERTHPKFSTIETR